MCVCLYIKSKGKTSGNNISVAVYDDVYTRRKERWKDGNSSIAAGAGRCSVFGGGALSHRCTRVAPAHRPASPCVIDRALRLSLSVRRARPAAPAGGGPTERFFFFVVALLQHGGVGVFAPFGPRDTHAHDPRIKYNRVYERFRFHDTALRGRSGSHNVSGHKRAV